MKVNQKNVFTDQNIQTELENIYSALNKVSFQQTFSSGDRGENIDCIITDVTANATASDDTSITHTLGRTPVGFFIVGQSASSLYYNGSGTNSDTQFFVKCTGASTRFRIVII